MDLPSIGLLIIRIVIGLTFAAHGTQKLFGWFGGGGVEGTGGFFDSLGIRPGKTMAVMAGLGELGSGLFFALGLLLPAAALVMVVVMLVGIFTAVGKNGYWATEGGYEYNVAIIVVAIGVALTGGGAYALDRIIFPGISF